MSKKYFCKNPNSSILPDSNNLEYFLSVPNIGQSLTDYRLPIIDNMETEDKPSRAYPLFLLSK